MACLLSHIKHTNTHTHTTHNVDSPLLTNRFNNKHSPVLTSLRRKHHHLDAISSRALTSIRHSTLRRNVNLGRHQSPQRQTRSRDVMRDETIPICATVVLGCVCACLSICCDVGRTRNARRDAVQFAPRCCRCYALYGATMLSMVLL